MAVVNEVTNAMYDTFNGIDSLKSVEFVGFREAPIERRGPFFFRKLVDLIIFLREYNLLSPLNSAGKKFA